MKAVYIDSFDIKTELMIREIGNIPLKNKSVRISVKASGLNRADLLQRRGLYPPPKGVNENIPGLECAGEVIEIGEEVHKFSVGDKVMALLPGMAQSDEVVVEEDIVMPMPKNLGYEEAAAIPEVFLTAYDSLIEQGQFSIGESVLIHSAGSGVGSAAIQLASVAGARKIYATASEGKLLKAQEVNIDVVGIDYKSEDFADVICKEHGDKVDIIFDLIGGNYWDKNLKCLSPQGRMILIGVLGGNKFPETARIDTILFKRAKVIGTLLRSREHWEKAKIISLFIKNIIPLFESGKLTPIIDTVFPAQEVNQAYNVLEKNENFGKIILTW